MIVRARSAAADRCPPSRSGAALRTLALVVLVAAAACGRSDTPANPDPTRNAKNQPNVLFRNDGDGTFTDVSEISGADDPGYRRGAVYLDFNGDGCLDLYLANIGTSPLQAQISRLYRNRCDWGNDWLIVKTEGTESNRDGIGARVTVTADGLTQIREVSAGGSNKSQNMLPVHFGLGKSKVVDTVEVRWPSGIVQTLTDLPANQKITVVEAR